MEKWVDVYKGNFLAQVACSKHVLARWTARSVTIREERWEKTTEDRQVGWEKIEW